MKKPQESQVHQQYVHKSHVCERPYWPSVETFIFSWYSLQKHRWTESRSVHIRGGGEGLGRISPVQGTNSSKLITTINNQVTRRLSNFYGATAHQTLLIFSPKVVTNSGDFSHALLVRDPTCTDNSNFM